MRISPDDDLPQLTACTALPARSGRSRRRWVVGLAATMIALSATSTVTPASAVASEVSDVPATSNPTGTVAARIATPERPPAPGRPRNGAIMTARGSGAGELAVDNTANGDDTVVTLARSGRATMAVYVHGGSRARVTRIPDGSFEVFVQRGRDWNDASKRFIGSGRSARMDRAATFSTRSAPGGTRFSRVSLTLYPISGGNTSLVPVSEGTVPS